jgi:hypothetical protein
LTYQWFRDDAPIAGATNTLLTLRDIQTGDEGGYWVEVRNTAGVAVSARAAVRLLPPGGLGVITDLLPSDRQIEISVLGDPGGRVRLERSADLLGWSVLTDTNDFAGTWNVKVGIGETSLTEFFRAARF